MKAGQLRHRVTLEQNLAVQNATGEPEENWVDFGDPVYSEILPVSGREFFAAKGINSEVTHKIRLRYLEGVTSGMRVVYGSRVFDIEVPLNVGERNRELHLMCVERRV